MRKFKWDLLDKKKINNKDYFLIIKNIKKLDKIIQIKSNILYIKIDELKVQNKIHLSKGNIIYSKNYLLSK